MQIFYKKNAQSANINAKWQYYCLKNHKIVTQKSFKLKFNKINF